MFGRRVRSMTPGDAHRALRRALADAQRGRRVPTSRRRLLALATRAGQAVGDDPMARSARASAAMYLAALRAGRRIKTSAHPAIVLEPMDPALAFEVDAAFEDPAFWEHELQLNDPRSTDPE